MRIQVPELEDQAWFPTWARDALTAFLRASTEHLGVFDAALPVLREVLARHGVQRIVDLCSGGGGPLVGLLAKLPDVEATLTDLYPNARAFAAATQRLGPRVVGCLDAVDATRLPPHLTGIRTVFNAFHHLPRTAAQQLLLDSAKSKQPLCVFEIVERDPITMALIAGVPLAALALAPFTRPTPLQLLLTWLLPVLPLAVGWDGMASCLRAYSMADLQSLADGARQHGYRFTVGRSARGRLPLRVTWLVGEPFDA